MRTWKKSNKKLHRSAKMRLRRIKICIKSTWNELTYPLNSPFLDPSQSSLRQTLKSWCEWIINKLLNQSYSDTYLRDLYCEEKKVDKCNFDAKLYFLIDDKGGLMFLEKVLKFSHNVRFFTYGILSQKLKMSETAKDTEMEPGMTRKSGAGPQVFYIEMAISKILGNGGMDQIDPPQPDVHYTLELAEIAVFNTQVYKLTRDLEVLHQLADNLQSDTRGHQALFTGNQMVNSIIKGDDSVASDIADYFFQQGNGARAHQLAAIGNCHIDSAWLWPFSETKRKVRRSFSSQLALMETYPEHKFVASQAQQWAWCKQYYPELFDRIKQKVTEGKFLPVGSTWIEMDGNIPSGESFIRQFLHGQRFYQQELGYTCKEFWLPDTFGYSAQIPALMHHMGLKKFLTQKLSWSLVNKFPHHNFTWEGIDGSSVLAHFPPGDSYEMNCTVDEAFRTLNNLQDKGRVGTSAFLFGYGDGGGGPTQDMLERLRRMKDVDGIPKVDIMTPDELFSQLEPDQHNMCRWVGELYLELHNGTYTTQAAMKRLCREAEFRLRDAEFMLSTAIANNGPGNLLPGSLSELDPAWKKVLLNQFHDVLPGSGIGIIYPEATTQYAEAIKVADEVWQQAADNLFGNDANTSVVMVNTLQWERSEVVTMQALTDNKSQGI
ncbi:unnamed protein product, partial [Meganyctiphanes norvegica]